MPLLNIRLEDIRLEACPCAAIGSPLARLVIRCRPEIEECDLCDTPIWVTSAGKQSDLPLLCTDCFKGTR